MPLIPNDPFRYFRELQKEMDSIFSVGSDLFSPHSIGTFSICLEETEDELIALCHVPGLKRKEEMEIEVEGRFLTVGRNMTGSYEMKGEHVYKSEAFSGYFRQTIPLPCAVRDWRTTYANGEFKIFMTKIKR